MAKKISKNKKTQKTNIKEKPKKTKEKICFVISPIGSEGTDIRNRYDQVLKYAITPAVEKCGFEVIRADSISKSGNITTQIIEHLIQDDMVVADLTDNNPNVFYELAIRHCFKKPYVQIKDNNTKIPFDISNLRTINFDYRYIDSLTRCTQEIVQQIEYSLNHNNESIETPISVALDYLSINPKSTEEKLLRIVSNLEEKVNYLNNKIDNQSNNQIQVSSPIISNSRAIDIGNPDLNLFSTKSILTDNTVKICSKC